MKSVIVFLLLSCTTFLGYCQDTTTIKKPDSLNVLSIGIRGQYFALYSKEYLVQFTARYNKHSVYLGVSNIRHYNEGKNYIQGINLGYIVYPFKKKKRFNWYAEYSFEQAKKSYTDSRTIQSATSSSSGSLICYGPQYIKVKYLIHQINLGANLNITRNIYTNFSLGYGIEGYEKDSFWRYCYTTGEAQIPNGNRPMNYNDHVYFKVGVGIDIPIIKKPKRSL